MAKNLLVLPAKMTLAGRSSTIRNAMAHSLDLREASIEDPNELKLFYNRFGIGEGQCAYCLTPYSAKTVDHLNPIIMDKKPSGYFTELNNIVPCCKDCNSSKGGKDFFDWYSDEKVQKEYLIGKKHLTQDMINNRLSVFREYVKKYKATKVPYEKIIGIEEWEYLLEEIDKINNELAELDDKCKVYQNKISSYVNEINKNR